MCIVALKCTEISSHHLSLSVIRRSRCSRLFLTLGRESLDPQRRTCSRPLNFLGFTSQPVACGVFTIPAQHMPWPECISVGGQQELWEVASPLKAPAE